MRRQGPVKWARVPGEPSIPRRSLRETEDCLLIALRIFVNFYKFSLRPVRARRTVTIAESQLWCCWRKFRIFGIFSRFGRSLGTSPGGEGGVPIPLGQKGRKMGQKAGFSCFGSKPLDSPSGPNPNGSKPLVSPSKGPF